ncbi:hypothetical protein BD414DRAFT_409158 [Trametes punicea]|nr:hypothetical protein BD414DRAFT_409158 [Trametes punicea]
MLWTLRPPRPWSLPCRPPHRSFSFTLNRRLSRAVAENVSKPPSFREQLAKAKQLPSFTDAVRKVPVRNQILFVVAGTAGALALGAHLTNYELVKWWTYIISMPQDAGIHRERPPTSEELIRARYFAFGRQLQSSLATLKTSMEQLPDTLKIMAVWSYVQVFQPILNASEGKRMCWVIGALNCAVWVAWRVPRWNALMMRSFTHNPLSGKSYTLLTSIFSHENFFHLLFNCMALASFGSAASQQLTIQQKKVEEQRGVLSEPTPKWHVLAFFVSAGLFAGLVSHVAYARWLYPKRIASLKSSGTPANALRSGSPAATAAREGQHSLGSSGAIYATFAITALGFPDAEITFIIPPWFPINIWTGFCTLLSIDLLGVIRGWKIFDHYAHLGGAAFGAFWYAYGAKIWYELRSWDLPVVFYLHGNKLKRALDPPSS